MRYYPFINYISNKYIYIFIIQSAFKIKFYICFKKNLFCFLKYDFLSRHNCIRIDNCARDLINKIQTSYYDLYIFGIKNLKQKKKYSKKFVNIRHYIS